MKPEKMRDMSKRYGIPLRVLRAYEQWNLCTNETQKAGKETKTDLQTDADLKNLSLVMTLYELGFTEQEARTYLCLCLQGPQTVQQRRRMLQMRRDALLQTIHDLEKLVARIDYLRCGIVELSETNVDQKRGTI